MSVRGYRTYHKTSQTDEMLRVYPLGVQADCERNLVILTLLI